MADSLPKFHFRPKQVWAIFAPKMPPTLLYNRDTFSIHIFTLKVTDLIFDKLKLTRINIFRFETFPRSLFHTVCAQTDVKGSERKIVAAEKKSHTHRLTHTHRHTHTYTHTFRHTCALRKPASIFMPVLHDSLKIAMFLLCS